MNKIVDYTIRDKIIQTHFFNQDITYFFDNVVNFYQAKSGTMKHEVKSIPGKYFYDKEFKFEKHNFDIYSLNHTFEVFTECINDNKIKYIITFPTAILFAKNKKYEEGWPKLIKEFVYYQDEFNGHKNYITLKEWGSNKGMNNIIEKYKLYGNKLINSSEIVEELK